MSSVKIIDSAAKRHERATQSFAIAIENVDSVAKMLESRLIWAFDTSAAHLLALKTVPMHGKRVTTDDKAAVSTAKTPTITIFGWTRERIVEMNYTVTEMSLI